MEVVITKQVPPEWKAKRPLETYETTYLYTGLSRYDTKKKVLTQIVKENGRIEYRQTPCPDPIVVSRSYYSELVRVTVYSQSPMVWKEETEQGLYDFFVQQPTQTA